MSQQTYKLLSLFYSAPCQLYLNKLEEKRIKKKENVAILLNFCQLDVCKMVSQSGLDLNFPNY